jgi:hypothetical protein
MRYDQPVHDLRARTNIHDALTNIALAEAHVSQGRYAQADEALRDAENHCRRAATDLMDERAGLISGRLADLRNRIERTRHTMRVRSGTLAATAKP